MAISAVTASVLLGGLICIGICTYSCIKTRFKINEQILKKSIEEISKNNQLMIYGFQHCKYLEVAAILKKHSFSILTFDSRDTLEGSLARIPYTIVSPSSLCKAQLVNLVFENYKREKMKKKLIPLIFFVDIENNKYPLTPKEWTSKDPRLNHIVTFQELKRLYKICEFTKNSDLTEEETHKLSRVCKAIEQIGKKMVIPVRLNKNSTITILSFPWHNKQFPTYWHTRMQTASSPSAFKINWRRELIQKITQFDQLHSMSYTQTT